ncbi:MAG: NAD-dependent epimerase/dehydratase family protein [Planctomycetota bacterium]
MSAETAGFEVDALVYGATGFAGGALAEALAKSGQRVRAMVRPTSDASRLESWGIEVVRGDLVSAEDVDASIRGARLVYNLASPFRDANAGYNGNYDVHVNGTNYILDSSRKHDVERVVNCTTAGVHGHNLEIPCNEDSPFNPGDEYQVTKLEGEEIFRAAMADGFPGVVVRPASMYGIGDLRMLKMYRLIQTGKWRMVGSGKVWNHPCYVDDLTLGFRLCGEHPDAVGGTYITGGPDPIYLNDYADLVADAVGVPRPTKRVPLAPVLAASHVCQAICKPLGIDPPLHPRRVHFFTHDRNFDIGRATREIGFVPQVTTAQGVLATADWYFDEGHLEGEKPERTPEQLAELAHVAAAHEAVLAPEIVPATSA